MFFFVFFQSNVAASNAKLSLFYDWIYFDPEKDSIMNIGKFISLILCWIFRDYLTAFWLSPDTPLSALRALARGLIMVEG